MGNYLYSNQQPSEVSVTKQAQISNHLSYGMPINMSVTPVGPIKACKVGGLETIVLRSTRPTASYDPYNIVDSIMHACTLHPKVCRPQVQAV